MSYYWPNRWIALLICFVGALVLTCTLFGIVIRREGLFRTTSEPRAIRVLPDNNTIAVGDSGGQLYLFDINMKQTTKSWRAHSGAIQSIAASADGCLIGSEGRERTAIVWDAATYEKLFSCDDPTGRNRLAEPHWVNSRIAFTSNSQGLAAFGYFWDIKSSERKSQYGARGAVALTDKWLVAGSRGGFSVLATKDLTRQFEIKDDSLRVFAISPDQQRLAVGRSTYDYGLRLYSVPDGTALAKFPELNAWVFSVDFSADSSLLAVAAREMGISIFDAKTAELIQILDTGKSDIYGIDFSDDGKLLVAIGTDHAVRVWKLPKFEELE